MKFDLRPFFRDPHVDARMNGGETSLRDMTGFDQEVIDHVLTTDGVMEFLTAVKRTVEALARTGAGSVRVAFRCVGGRHRSVVCAETLSKWLREMGFAVTVEHRDVGKPVIRRG